MDYFRNMVEHGQAFTSEHLQKVAEQLSEEDLSEKGVRE